MKRLAITLVFFLLPALAMGQSWPVYQTPYVNDYANVIEEGAEGRITAALESLREQTGIEATVLTIYTRWGYEDAGSLEDFATGLFNSWGIGNPETNDGILILVASEDHELRIELGSGYGTAFNREAQDIIDRVFLPAFRAGDHSGGIEDGTAAVIERIAMVNHAGAEPAPVHGTDNGFVIGLVAAIAALGIGGIVVGRRMRDYLSRCPQCGERGLHFEKHVLERATTSSTGRGEKATTCPHCGYHDTVIYTIPAVSSSSSSSSSGAFSGGSSSGGGASGRW